MRLSTLFRTAYVLAFSLTLWGCIGAEQTKPAQPVGFGGLQPTQEDKDAGLVGILSDFALKN